MVQEALSDARDRMNGAIKSLEEDLGAIRTGRASPALVDKMLIEYYGVPTPLRQLATISVPEPRSLTIRPFDASSLKDIERAILSSDLGLNPNNDGQNIHLNLPQLTEDRRKDLVKVVAKRVEEGKVAIRNVRRDIIRDLREFEDEKMISEDEMHRGEDEVQKLTDKYVEEIDKIGDVKEKEVLEI